MQSTLSHNETTGASERSARRFASIFPPARLSAGERELLRLREQRAANTNAQRVRTAVSR